MKKKQLILFDIDGTLTVARKVIEQQMIDKLNELKQYVTIGCVGGSDFKHINEQLTSPIFNSLEYAFCENGLSGYKFGKKFHNKSIVEELGNDFIKNFVNFCLIYIANLDIPIKRGTFIEFRTGMINVSPIGRNCSQEERDDYEKYDQEHQIRQKMVDICREKFGDKLSFSIGGQISFDCVPHGWNKTYCLQFVEKEFEEIYFFGDKTYPGGNDFEIYNDQRLKGRFTVNGYQETVKILDQHFIKKYQ